MPIPDKNNAPDNGRDAAVSAELHSLTDTALPKNPETTNISSSISSFPIHSSYLVSTEQSIGLSQSWASQFRAGSWDDYIASTIGGRATLERSPKGSRLVVDAAVLTVDIVNSTGFLEEVERQGQSPGQALNTIFSPLASAIKVRGAHFANIVGDGLSAIFTHEPAAWDALNSALELQEQWKRDRIGNVLSPELRVGLAYGRVELQPLGDDGQARVIGSAVNRAFHAASGKGKAEQLPDFAPGFSIFLDRSFRTKVNLPGLMAKAA